MPEPIDTARFLGAPFRNGGTGPDAYDCWGLVRAIAHSAGLLLPEYPHVPCDFANLVSRSVAEAILEGHWEHQPDPEVLDVVVMSTVPGFLNHVGIMVRRDAFMHTTRLTGAIITSLHNERWKHSLRGCYRWHP